jgi:anti-anti-sigma factor
MTDDFRRRQGPGRRSPGGLSGAGTGSGGDESPVLDQVFDGDSLYTLRAAVAAHGSQAGLAEGRVGDLVLAVHELASNAVVHGAGRGRVQIWNTGEALHCEVTDDGPQPAAAETRARESVVWRTEPGHGLWLIRQIADQTSVQPGPAGTVTTVTFALGRAEKLPRYHLAEQVVGGYTVITVTGELDLSSAAHFTHAVSELVSAAPAVRLVLDLSALTWWDSSGLAALIVAQHQVSAHPDAQMVIVGLPGHLLQRLRATGLDGQFTMAGTAAEATGMFTSPA